MKKSSLKIIRTEFRNEKNILTDVKQSIILQQINTSKPLLKLLHANIKGQCCSVNEVYFLCE